MPLPFMISVSLLQIKLEDYNPEICCNKWDAMKVLVMSSCVCASSHGINKEWPITGNRQVGETNSWWLPTTFA